MGYAMAMGPCLACGQVFSFNPVRVPALSLNGRPKEPICGPCFHRLNAIRKERGLELWADPLPGAYDACPEEELPI